MTKMLRLTASLLALSVALMASPAGAAAEAVAEQVIPVSPAPVGKSAPAIPQVISGRVVEVRTLATVRNVLPDPAKNLVLLLPPAVSNLIGTQRVLGVRYNVEPTETRETATGTEAIYKVAQVPGGEVLTFERIYTVELLNNTSLPLMAEASIDSRYLTAEPGVEADHPQIRAEALRVTTGVQGTEAKVEGLIKFVIGRLKYDLNANSRNRGGLAGFETGYGVCSEYAGLFAAMARAAGIPTRLVYGWARSSGLQGSLDDQNRHVWAEYYDAGRGWVAVDPTFAEVQEDVLAFDAENHLAQDLANTSFSASFGGRGLLSIMVDQRLTQLSAAKR